MHTLLDRVSRTTLGCLTAFFALTAECAEPSASPVEAVWKSQRLVFEYRSEGRVYGCDILEYKIGMILRRLGARERLEVRPSRCHDHSGRNRFEVLMQSPVAATADNIREITTYTAEELLAARVRGIALPSSAELERFPAVWQSVAFHRDGALYLEAGDCALVQQLRRQILPRMAIVVTRDIVGIDCVQELTGITATRFVVTALVPATGPSTQR